MFQFGKIRVSCSVCGNAFRISRKECGTWVKCPHCGASITVQVGGGFVAQGAISVHEYEANAPGIIAIKWLDLFGVPTPKTDKEAVAQLRALRDPIVKALGNVFVGFPAGHPLDDGWMGNIYAGIYHSDIFKDLPFRPGDKWNGVQLSDEIQLKLIRLVKGFLSASDWSRLRVRNLAGLKNRYASEFIEVSFACPHCAQKLEVDAEGSGMNVSCPTCGGSITIPQPSPKAKTRRPRKQLAQARK